MKPLKYNYKIDTNPSLIYNNLENSFDNRTINVNNSSNYLLKRAGIIKNLRSINKKLNFKDHTFFLALHYLDHVMLNFETQIRSELIGLCSIILAGKTN